MNRGDIGMKGLETPHADVLAVDCPCLHKALERLPDHMDGTGMRELETQRAGVIWLASAVAHRSEVLGKQHGDVRRYSEAAGGTWLENGWLDVMEALVIQLSSDMSAVQFLLSVRAMAQEMEPREEMEPRSRGFPSTTASWTSMACVLSFHADWEIDLLPFLSFLAQLRRDSVRSPRHMQ